MGISRSKVWFSIGIIESEDLLEDFEQVLG